MPSLAYVRDDPRWQEKLHLLFSDLIGWKQPAFVRLVTDDLVLTLEQSRQSPDRREWVIRQVFRVATAEETGDALEYELVLVRNISPPDATGRYLVSQDELMLEHNWFPCPEDFFKPFPRAVWNWLRQAKGVPLPPLDGAG